MLSPEQLEELAEKIAAKMGAEERKLLIPTKEAAAMVGLDRRSFRQFMAANHILPRHCGNKDLWPYKKLKELAA